MVEGRYKEKLQLLEDKVYYKTVSNQTAKITSYVDLLERC